MTIRQGKGTTGFDPNDVAWRTEAACKGKATVLWFPEHTSKNAQSEANGPMWAYPRSICEQCPVKFECLEWALATELDGTTRHGMAGGLTPKERKAEQIRRGVKFIRRAIFVRGVPKSATLDLYPCGHERTKKNTVKNGGDTPRGRCRECVNEANRKRYATLKSAAETPIARAVPRLRTRR